MHLTFPQQTTAAGLSVLAHLGIAALLLASVFASRSTPTPPTLLPIAVTLIPPKAPAESAIATVPAAPAAPVVEAPPPPVMPKIAVAPTPIVPPKPIPKPAPKPILKPKPKPEPVLKPKPKPESKPKPASFARPESSTQQQAEDRRVSSLPLGQGAGSGPSAAVSTTTGAAGTATGATGATTAADSRAAPLPGNPKPTYPAFARRLGQEGRVIVRVRVLPTGTIGTAEIARSSGYAVLDEAALATIKRWRFRPAQQSGQSVDATLDVPISFRLNDQG